jgi:hypothetical protein
MRVRAEAVAALSLQPGTLCTDQHAALVAEKVALNLRPSLSKRERALQRARRRGKTNIPAYGGDVCLHRSNAR